ncbi:MAG TPA: hypothetical protein VGX94_01430 [Terriglobia bacterium]|nr:hypothetical protein [Terriglobia bacterium]
MWRAEDQEVREETDLPPSRGLADYLEARRECGLGRMLANLVLEPPDPFKPKDRRKAKKGFVITLLTLVALTAWFSWFNLIR